jgi:phospholipid/cholesterol/gamma-HCH transport system ATP-binding protein
MSIELREVTKAFGARKVLSGASLDVHEGETLALIGYSGSGKSVLLKAIVGLLAPDSGTIVVDDEDVIHLSRAELYALRRRVGYVFQFAALFDSMTVYDNVAMGLRRMRLPESEVGARVRDALALVELDGFGPRLPAELSGGQRKRAGLARSIAFRPKYLLYDEPTTGLDPVTTAVIDGLITKLARELRVTSVLITHNMTSAFRVANRVAMLYRGRIRFHGTPDETRRTSDPVVRSFVEGRPELLGEGE